MSVMTIRPMISGKFAGSTTQAVTAAKSFGVLPPYAVASNPAGSPAWNCAALEELDFSAASVAKLAPKASSAGNSTAPGLAKRVAKIWDSSSYDTPVRRVNACTVIDCSVVSTGGVRSGPGSRTPLQFQRRIGEQRVFVARNG